MADSLSRIIKDLTDMRTAEWMTAKQAAKHLGCESVKAYEKIAAREDIPRHDLSVRAPRYNRAELDAWLMGRRALGRLLEWRTLATGARSAEWGRRRLLTRYR